MSPHRERVVRGTVANEHLVHLFDEPASLVEAVSRDLFDGWQRGDTLLVVARPGTDPGELEAQGCPISELIASGRLTVFDAAPTLATFMVNGEPDPEKFDASVGARVRRACDESPGGFTAYGEMVDILAAQGNFIAAEHLEQALWNELASRCSFRLLCGYSTAHFGDERNTRHLDRICSQHDETGALPRDLLASWLLADRRSNYHIDAPG